MHNDHACDHEDEQAKNNVVALPRRAPRVLAILEMLRWAPIRGSTDFAVFTSLALHVDAQGRCWPSIDVVAAIARTSRSAAKRSLARLESAGLIRVQRRRRADGKRQSNVYELPLYESQQEDAANAGTSPSSGAIIARCVGIKSTGRPKVQIEPLAKVHCEPITGSFS